MELNQAEVLNVEKVLKEATDLKVRELNELQLAFVGGGIGETAI